MDRIGRQALRQQRLDVEDGSVEDGSVEDGSTVEGIEVGDPQPPALRLQQLAP
jgi:hypothetical protein